MQGFGFNNSNWKGGRRWNGRYWMIKVNDHPSVSHLQIKHRYVAEHRLIMEEFLGRYLTSEEHVHHIDENPHNNEISNLEIVSKAEHNRKHKRVTEYLKNGGNRNVFVNKKIGAFFG